MIRALWERLPDGLKQPFWTLKHGAPPERQWLRHVMNADVRAVVDSLRPADLDVVEVSGDLWRDHGFRSYTSLSYADLDICHPPDVLPQFDLVLCEQVLEHVEDPITAVRTLRSLCRDGGHVLVSTPFLLRIHPHPGDYWRFTPDGMRVLLSGQGLEPVWIRGWGNRAVVRANLGRWKPIRPWRSRANDPMLPIVVWALAQPSPPPEDEARPPLA